MVSHVSHYPYKKLHHVIHYSLLHHAYHLQEPEPQLLMFQHYFVPHRCICPGQSRLFVGTAILRLRSMKQVGSYHTCKIEPRCVTEVGNGPSPLSVSLNQSIRIGWSPSIIWQSIRGESLGRTSCCCGSRRSIGIAVYMDGIENIIEIGG